MSKMVKKLLEEFEIRALLSYVREIQPLNYIGPTLFPVNSIQDLTFEYWKSLNKLPVMARVQTYGAETPIASREGIEKVKGEIPPIKNKIDLGERYLIALRREGLGDYDIVKNKVFDDLDAMTESVLSRIEAMRIEAISTGKLSIAENGVVMTVDYLVPSDHQDTLESTALWSAGSTATPIDDIQKWVDKIVDDTGIRPTRALTSNTAVASLLQCEQIRKMIYGDNGAARAISLSEINALMEKMDLPTIATYDARARIMAEDGEISTFRFFPAAKFVLLPPDTLGETLYGPTAEALMSDAELTAEEMAGLYASVWGTQDPPTVWTKAAVTAIPTFPMADSIFIAQVLS